MFRYKFFLVFNLVIFSQSHPIQFDYGAPRDIYDKFTKSQNSSLRGFGITTKDSIKWPDGIVYYEIDQSFSQNDIAVILSGMKLIESSTRQNGKDCIRFEQRSNQPDYVRIINSTGCWSYVGRQSSGAQNLSLQIPFDINSGSCLFTGTASHELIHALGFVHEQSRPDRDSHVIIRWENIDSIYWSQFQRYSSLLGDTMGFNYDYDSIMHYSSYAFSKNGYPTIIPRNRPTFIRNKFNQTFLSQTDVNEIREFYNCQSVKSLATKIILNSFEIKIIIEFFILKSIVFLINF